MNARGLNFSAELANPHSCSAWPDGSVHVNRCASDLFPTKLSSQYRSSPAIIMLKLERVPFDLFG